MNFELIYKGRRLVEALQEKRWALRAATDAMYEAQKQYEVKMLQLLGKEVGAVSFEPTWSCNADGMDNHVFVGGYGERGYGRYKCAFCGCTDHND